jgi:hypothetical protein
MQKNCYFYLRWLFCLFSILIMLSINNICAKEKSGLILSGIDTLHLPIDKGFDFVTSSICTVYSSSSCILHFDFQYYPPSYKYMIFVRLGYSVIAGKLNLDSIKSAPNDSIFGKFNDSRVDSFPPESLSFRIGTSYILKTGPDPRPFWAGVYFAKIRILGLDVIDSASHKIKMRFLWACQLTHARNLTTSGLDTFHLEPPTLNQPRNNLLMKTSHSSASQAVFKVSGNSFSLPQELTGKVKWISVWDLQGKRLAEIKLNKSNLLIQMPKDLRRNGILIVRAEITKQNR